MKNARGFVMTRRRFVYSHVPTSHIYTFLRLRPVVILILPSIAVLAQGQQLL